MVWFSPSDLVNGRALDFDLKARRESTTRTLSGPAQDQQPRATPLYSLNGQRRMRSVALSSLAPDLPRSRIGTLDRRDAAADYARCQLSS